jgi:CBS domain-containing protein
MRRSQMTVDQLMSTALITVAAGENVSSADFDMKLARIRHVLVVDQRGHLVGLVSDRDLLRAMNRKGDRPIRIADVMTPDPVTVQTGDPAHEALELLLERKIGCLPVEGDDGQLVGILTATDFLELAHRYLVHDEETRAERATR